MHIPDGFLTANTWIPAWLISIAGIGYCLKKTALVLKDRMVPLMGVMSAFIFAAQMLNFPVIGGTSGHLLGGVLSAVLLGPYGGAIVIFVVLIAQCLIFQDGGLTTLGANVFNMSFVGAIGGYFVYRFIRRITCCLVLRRESQRQVSGNKGLIIATSLAAWLSVVMSSCVCAIELAMSGTLPLKVALPAMAGVHALIGIGEAIITSMIIGFVLRVRPDLIYK